MRDRAKRLVGLAGAAVILLAASVFGGAQTNVVPSRITRAIDPSQLTVLRGNTSPLAQARYDRGAAPASLPMRHMLLVLKRGAQQEDALETLLEQQQDAASPNYHHWLTPQQFGQQFGPSDQDIQTIVSWLQSQGFQIDQVSNGRTVIEFSGTAGEVQSAFHTAMHQYLVNGQNHWANSSDPQIPSALSPVVVGIDTLYNFPRVPLYHLAVSPQGPIGIGGTSPSSGQYTFPNPCSAYAQPCNFAVGPYDFATIYNILPLWAQSPAIDGTGETIAIVGESDINSQDFTSFRSYFGLPAGNLKVIVNGADPGTVAGDETESDLDVEWAGAVAKGANIDLVVSQTTEASLGVDLSAQYIVDNDLAPILSESYGVCEFFLGTAGNEFYDQLWQQAAAEGISVIVSSGDSGSATCDGNVGTPGPARNGISVNGIASTPYNLAMGGTDFNDLNDAGLFWNTTNAAAPGSSGGVASLSVKGYIPETTWNDTCTNQELLSIFGTANASQTCNDSEVTQAYPFLLDLAGGGGGRSACTSSSGQDMTSCTAPYPKPTWQTALTPGDGARDLPDLAMFASNGFNGSFYVVCEADQLGTNNIISVGSGTPSTSCSASDPNTGIIGLGGTSAPTPAFAGIMALIDQATASAQGNPNYVLYKLAAQAGNSCASVANPASTCVFYDVPTGSTISMPCITGSSDCNVASGNQYGLLYDGSNPAYNTASGYDLATGLGSVNAANLVAKWKSFVLDLKGSSTSLTLTPPSGGSLTNLTHGQTVTFNTSVSAVAPATGTPTGAVALIANTGSTGQQSLQTVTLDSNGNGSGTTNVLPGGTYTVQARYPGDGTFASSASSGTSVTVNPEASKMTIAYELLDPNTGGVTNPSATTAVFGTPALLRVNITSASGDACPNNAPGDKGCPTGDVTLTDNGSSLDGGTFPLNPEGYVEDQAIDLTGGTHTIGAAYGGDASYNPPNPNPATQTLTITPAATQTSGSSNGGNTVGSYVQLHADIVAYPIYSAHGPTGTVTFFLGGTQLGSGAVSGFVGAGQASASGNFSTNSLPHGQDSISADYSGDANYASSASGPFVVNVLWPTTMGVTSSTPSIQYGSPVTFTAQVSSSQTGAPAITGTVDFSGGGYTLGSAAVSNGVAQLTTTAVPGGNTMVEALYQGDNNYAGAQATVTETVLPDSTTTVLTTSNATVIQGQSVTLVATITPSVGGPSAPTGNVSFVLNGSSIGYGFVSNGQAQLTTTTLPLGSDVITAQYVSGDQNYSSSTSSALTVTVNLPPTFSMTANPATIAIAAPGQSGSTTLTFTGEYGFSTNGAAPLTVSCSGLPAYSSCGASPSSVTMAANGIATATVTVMTTAPSAAAPDGRNFGGRSGANRETMMALAALLLLVALAIALGVGGRTRRWGLAFALVALGFAFINAGCGGSGGGTQPTMTGTPAGTQHIAIAATINGVTQTAPVTLDVQ